MKKVIVNILFMLVAFMGVSQSNSYYKVGDTLYYQKNRATYTKTNTFVIVKETNVGQNSNVYNIEKYIVTGTKPVLDSKFTTNGLQILKANGDFISYHKNGNKASEGKTVNGKKGTDTWTYYYENGKKKSEEKVSKESFFNEKTQNLVINFWDAKGNQTVTNGNGFAEFISDEDGYLYKGSYKEGVKDGMWTTYDGKLKRYEETYKKGKLTKGTSWNKKGESFTYKEISSPAYYKKRDNSTVRKYVGKNFNSNTSGVIGDMLINFIVTKEGYVREVEIIRGLTIDYNTEVKQIISQMEGWVPAKNRGESLNSNYSLSLRFSE